MCTYVTARAELGVGTTQDMDPRHPGTRIVPGIARAHLTVYEADEECSDTLPTVAELLACAEPATDLVSIERYTGMPLRIDAAALREFAPGLRVGPGWSFVTNEVLDRARETP